MGKKENQMKQISYDAYLKFIGICALAEEYNRQSEKLVKLAGALLEIEPDEWDGYGHLSDEFYGTSINPDEVLNKLKIKIPAISIHNQTSEGD